MGDFLTLSMSFIRGEFGERVWGSENNGGLRPIADGCEQPAARAGDDADLLRHIFTEARVGYWMAESRPQDDARHRRNPVATHTTMNSGVTNDETTSTMSGVPVGSPHERGP